MLDHKKLIEFEYFPVELPKCFTTKSVVKHLSTILGQINATNYCASIPFSFTAYKNEYARRRMALPNLYHYIKIVEVICSHEADLMAIYDKSSSSLTKPSKKQKDTGNRAFNRISNSPNETRSINENLFQSNTLCLKLDINNFFDSIYTHSVVWAIHSKSVAKTNPHDNSLFGNQLDKCLQGLNDKQTHGILIGNAVSRLVSEIILCRIDECIEKEFKNIGFCRFVDDYVFYLKEGYSQTTTVEQIVCFVRNHLLEYDLMLNEKKTTITKAPFVLGQNGIDEIKSVTTLDPYPYFNRMIFIFSKYNDIALLKYGLKVVQCLTTKEDIHRLFPLLINLWARFPNLAEYILPILYVNKDELNGKEKNRFQQVLRKILEDGFVYRHDVEVVWAIWTMVLFNYPITSRVMSTLAKTNNDLAILIALESLKDSKPKYYSEALQTITNRIVSDLGPIADSSEAMLKTHWFLIYELVVKGMATSGLLVDYVNNNQFFKKMLDLSVDLYDVNVRPVNAENKNTTKQNKQKLKILLDNNISTEDNSKNERLANEIYRIMSQSRDWSY